LSDAARFFRGRRARRRLSSFAAVAHAIGKPIDGGVYSVEAEFARLKSVRLPCNNDVTAVAGSIMCQLPD
jgi:hypothetical protein